MKKYKKGYASSVQIHVDVSCEVLLSQVEK